MGDVVSKCKFFADFGRGAVGGGGSRLLTKVKSADVKDDGDIEVVAAAGVDQGAGFREKQGGGEIQLTVYRETGTPEVDYDQLKEDKKVWTFTMQDEGSGKRRSFTVRVAKVEPKADEQGVNEDTVTLKWTKRYNR